MAINYEDQRFKDVEAQKQQELTKNEQLYGDMISQVGDKYQGLIDASKEAAEKQSQLQQEQTDFEVKKIEQQKEQAQKDYIKEQSGAFADWQKQSNPHGVNAEKIAANGLQGSGFSESSLVNMYNTYQNRVTAARQSIDQIMVSYNNAATEARLQNSAVLAQIAADTLEQQLTLQLEGFNYKNDLLIQKAAREDEIDSRYYSRWLDVLAQIEAEEAEAAAVSSSGGSYSGSGGGSDVILDIRDDEEPPEDNQGVFSKVANTIKALAEPPTWVKSLGNTVKSLTTPIDQSSVSALGYGNLTASQLAALVDQGTVGYRENNGKLIFYKK